MARGGHARDRPRVPADAEAVVELGVAGVCEPLSRGHDLLCAGAQEARAAVHDADARAQREGAAAVRVAAHADAHADPAPRPGVTAQPRRAVAGPGEHVAAPRDRAAPRPQRAHAAVAIDDGLDPRARGRRAPEAPRELDELRRVGARDVVQRARRRAVAAAAAAGADQPRRAGCGRPRAAPRRPTRGRAAWSTAPRSARPAAGAAWQDERRAAVDGLADEVAADDGDPGEVAGRAVARAGHEVAAVEAGERARPAVDRGHGLAAADDAVREHGADRAAEAPRVDVEHVHTPRPPGQRRPVVAGEVDLRIGDLGGGEPRGGLLGGRLPREAADARDVGDRSGERAVRRVGVDLEDARVEPEPARLRRGLRGLASARG